MDATSSPGSSGDESTGGMFVMPEDVPGAGDCDLFGQDCPEGQKCMPWADDGGNAWNAAKCSPVDPDPGQVGDPCLVEGSGVSGVDNCDVGVMCYNVDPTTNMGTCYEICGGSPAAPVCEASEAVCAIYNDGVLPLCFPSCDPLAQDCGGVTQVCVAAPANDGFICILDSLPNDPGQFGEPCEFANACDPGLFCAVAGVVPDCTNPGGCCSEFCDLTVGDPDAECSGQGGGQVCLPWWGTVEDAAPGWEDVGYCTLPE
jgi:hypothetical protein